MKIFYIASFERLWDEECIAQAFENIGCEVIRREERKYTNAQLLRDIRETKPDYVFFAKLLIRENGFDLLREIKKLGIPSVSWTFDLYIGYCRENQIPQLPFFHADYVFTTDGGHDKEFKEKGINHFCVRQGIYSPQATLGLTKPEYRFDVIFVGTRNINYPFRQELCEFLKKNYDFKWVGVDDPNTFRGYDLNGLYTTTKIVVGDSVPSPNYWSNRPYETMGRGGFTIFPEIKGLKNEFPDIVTYKQCDLQDLKKKIDYYLEHDIERSSIQIKLFDFIRDNYTYEQRCQKILQILEQNRGGIIG